MIIAEKTLIMLVVALAVLISLLLTAIKNAEIARIREHDQWLYQQNEELKEKSSLEDHLTSLRETE